MLKLGRYWPWKTVSSHLNTCLPEWKLLYLYMFHRILFLLLIVSSLSCNFNRCADCFQSFSEHRLQEYSKCRALNHWIKNKHNKFFIMLERDSVNVHSNTRHSSHYKSENWVAAYSWFWKFFNRLAKSQRVLPSSWILDECNLYCKIVIYCCLSEVCMIKTVSHSTKMWCINV